tara:strand:- start:35 stop:493 length:459 start_codon:yes stop_codon:yes gene_type:complete
MVSNDITYLVLSLDGPITGADGRSYVADLREDRDELINDINAGDDAQFLVAGFPAYSLDVQDAIVENLPIALAFIFISTVILIFIQVRSVIIPIKAIIMNILSISATLVCLSLCSNGAMEKVCSISQPNRLKPPTQSLSSVSCLVYRWIMKS